MSHVRSDGRITEDGVPKEGACLGGGVGQKTKKGRGEDSPTRKRTILSAGSIFWFNSHP